MLVLISFSGSQLNINLRLNYTFMYVKLMQARFTTSFFMKNDYNIAFACNVYFMILD